MGFQVNFGNAAFAVPGAVVDHFIRLAGEKELKVLLCVLRRPEETITADSVAAYLHIDTEAAQEALDFWVQADVLRRGESAPAASFSFAVPAASTPVQEAAPAVAPVTTPAAAETPLLDISPVSSQRSSREIKLDPSEIAAAVEGSQELSDLFSLAEKTLGKPLNHMEQRSLIWMCQYLNMPGSIILMLLEYCVSIGKYSISYAESIAIRWQSEGITKLEDVESVLQQMAKEQGFISELRRRFEMKRSPTSKQKAYIDLWQKAGYSMELIGYAYEITVENIEKLDFKYINTILESWAVNGVKDVAAAQALREQPKENRAKKSARQEPMSQHEVDEMNDYLSVVNRFKEDETDE